MRTYTQFFPSPCDSKGAVLLVHGAGEHLDRYQWLIDRWNQVGFDVYGGDLPGYGRSEGKRGHINSFEDYLQAVDDWFQALTKKTDSEPFLFGHSLGGLISARFMETRKRKVKGVVLSSPCFGISMKVPPWKQQIAKGLNMIYPSLVMSAGIKPEFVSRNQSILQVYSTDPLNTKGASVRWYMELEKNMLVNRQENHCFPDVPLLIHQAGHDLVVDAAEVRSWFDQSQIKDKTYKEWPGLYHEILNEPERDLVFTEIYRWMKQRNE
ncbi:alpha/beta hydrolase [Ammoniphilus resinae]|uniref:Lysophospholipase n=1 Tax=Ammoniphilus resinae TaxID=861532 RepID=A0ABS4GUJ7_9BACL|nr:alpha/beta hydrolase [Ammoniphilus resinae]MBP1933924.1 lysophospholipase [Ammoniphilus resinae]